MQTTNTNSPTEIASAFYQAFKQRDANLMNSYYANDIHFSDPVFQNLNANQTKNMWLLLCQRAKNFSLEFEIISANDNWVIVNWEANYTFQATGRMVKNKIQAKLKIENGKIVEHTDHFDFWNWSTQALGWTGKLLGWTPFLKRKIRKEAMHSLEKFTALNLAQK